MRVERKECLAERFEKLLVPIIFLIIVTILAMEVKQISADVSINNPFSDCYEVEVLKRRNADGTIETMMQEMCLIGKPMIKKELSNGKVMFVPMNGTLL